MCVCYCHPSKHKQELIYGLLLVHKGECAAIFGLTVAPCSPSAHRSASLPPCRLQQDVHSVAGQRADPAAPGRFHPRRPVHKAQTRSPNKCQQQRIETYGDLTVSVLQVTTSWCICRTVSSTVSTPGSRRCSVTRSSSLVTRRCCSHAPAPFLVRRSRLSLLHVSRRPQGEDVNLGLQCRPTDVAVLHAEDASRCSLLDLAAGTIHAAELSPAYLLQVLESNTPSR